MRFSSDTEMMGSASFPMPPSPLPTPSTSPPRSDTYELLDVSQAEEGEKLASSRPASCARRGRRVSDGLRVLNAEATALSNLASFYEVDEFAQGEFERAVRAITSRCVDEAKLVLIGVGKSGLVARKLVATFQSLGIRAVFLHPTEALHGDLGIVGRHDTLLFITYSGKTPELLGLLPHLDASLPKILLTSHIRRADTCEMLRLAPDAILLPAPIPEPERHSIGVAAPTASTTVAMAVGDALAVAAANELHCDVPSVFARNHPGGAIGATAVKAGLAPGQ